MDPVFKVVVGNGGFKIVDMYGAVFGSYASEEDADFYAELLNEKWENGRVRL